MNLFILYLMHAWQFDIGYSILLVIFDKIHIINYVWSSRKQTKKNKMKRCE